MTEKRVRLPRVKTAEKNLYRVGDAYYYRLGDFEKSLGTFPSEKAAIEYKKVFEAKRDSVGAVAYKFRVKDVWPDYESSRDPANAKKHVSRKVLSPRTFKELQLLYSGHLREFFGNKKLSDIDSQLWSQYVQQSSVGDLANHRKVFGKFLKWCNSQGYMRSMPVMEIPAVKRRQRPILKPEQIEAILKHSQGKTLVLAGLYLFMAVRRSEIARLEWSSVDLERGILQIKEETTRTRKARAVPINAFVLVILRKWKERQIETGVKSRYLFPKVGSPNEHTEDSTFSKPWKRMLRKADLSGVNPHDLRATYEYFANKRADFTDTQREKMAGAAIEVQRKHYVSFEAEDMRGLEEVVVFPGLEHVLAEKLSARIEDGDDTGKTRVSKNVSGKKSGRRTIVRKDSV